MSTKTLAILALSLTVAGSAHAQRSSRWEVMDDSTVSRTLSFAAGGGRTLDVRNINGSIRVEGTDESAAQLSIRKVIRAETREDLADAQRDVRLEFRDGAPRVEATVIDRSGHICGEPWNDRGPRHDRVRYEVKYDFTIRVPRDVALRLCTINGGDVIVNGTRGDFDVDNVNGLIEMKGVAGSGSAHTVNGPVTVSFTANPKQATSFKSVNGNIDINFLDGLGADFAMKTMNGGLYTDFDSQPLPNTMTAAGERRDGKFVYRANQYTRVRVGNGGPQITFETLNGNVRARRTGSTR
ncbi:MAG TPA: hypothetical protein VNT81_23420 [Vicinamibacterales bacterium]|nr:hypothetical protein [Vicinamibacterales bacterium]